MDVEAPVSDRAVAIQAAPGFVDERLQSIVKGNDKAALSGLARNKFLPVEYLRKVRVRLDELGDHFGVWMARETLADTKKTQAPNDPQELFGEKGNFLEDKIDFVGRRILYYEAQLQSVKKRLTKAVIALAVIWLGWKLFVWFLN